MADLHDLQPEHGVRFPSPAFAASRYRPMSILLALFLPRYLREPLGIGNKHVGYIYLVDTNKKIRWAACADPKSEEVAALTTCTKVLLDRLAKQQEPAVETSSIPAVEQQ